MDAEVRYGFGKNWRKYVDSHVDDRAITLARNSLISALKLPDLKGKSFLDIGCGSGLFSYAAFLLGAARVVSFDYDADSVECCRSMRNLAGNPDTWEVFQGSILDDDLIRKLPRFDVVYSFGVLHHTGQMWKAIQNASKLVDPTGRFYFTIYNKVEYKTLTTFRGSHFWYRMKKAYNRSRIFRAIVLPTYVCGQFLKLVVKWPLTGKTPVRQIQEYDGARGMSWYRDIHDWLGGFPFEFARVDELFRFCKNDLGFKLEDLQNNGMNCLLLAKENSVESRCPPMS
jgi:2-polyprenyl-3-methyl-5-hydroxy-6-metoxy-1,4-benzoquinol methylase